MKSKHVTSLSTIAALIVAALVFVLGGGPKDDGPIGMGPGTQDQPALSGQPGENRNAEGIAPAVADPRASDGSPRTAEPIAGSHPGSGTIDGRIVLAAGLPQAVTGYTILFEEAVNQNAPERTPTRRPRNWTRGFKADPGVSPLFFTERDVAFSEYGYRVSVFVPGINGSDQFVRCDESSPYSEVSLALTPGGPFSLRLIDQYRGPVVDHRVQLRPKGRPEGRAFQDKTSDTFGVAVFESLLAGTWEVFVDDQPEGEITVRPPGIVNDEAALGVQSAVLTVPLGKALKVEAFDAAGHGLIDVDLVLVATDTTENRRFTAKTDNTGCWTFPSIMPGRWQLDASGGGSYSQTSRMVEVPADRDPEPVRVRLVRVR